MREFEASKVWARQTTLLLRTLPGGEKLMVRVPVRMHFDGPDWFLSVSGVVLDEETDARLHAAFDAAEPPKDARVQWNPLNCYGEAELYKRLEGDTLEDDPSLVSPPRN